MDRTSEPILLQRINSDIPYAAVVRRRTGKSLTEWDEEVRNRRRRALQEGLIEEDHLFTEEEATVASIKYGLSPDDFYPDLVDVKEIRATDPHFKAPVCKTTGKTADTVKRYRLGPGVLAYYTREIAADTEPIPN